MKLYDVIRKEKLPEKAQEEPREDFVFENKPKPASRRKKIIFFALVGVFVCIIYILGVKLVRAKVTIYERSIPFNIENTTLELPHEKNSDPKRLSFQTMTIQSEINREIFGSELTQVTGKAKGSVIFINEYSKSSITLKSGTKLIGQNGKTYQTNQSVVIPGYTLDAKKKKVSGASSSIVITAVETGPNSNSKGMSLSISGFSGAKKAQVYARTAGELTGGESGMRHTISEAEREGVVESLKTQLSERLRRETRAQVPSGFITYPDLQFISIDPDSLSLSGEGVKFSAKIKGTMVSYLIPQSLLENAIAKEVLSNSSYREVAIPNISDLDVSPESAIPANSGTPPNSISIKISGSGNIITKAPKELIKQALIGISRNKFDSLIANFQEIESAEFKLTPFWSPFFPNQDRLFNIETK
ncbi:MAG TPA: hypothetical protein PLQ20_02680 [Candidatus Paceibacterota bacterium]|nr:hypothetical protein [Candidatus Paceibacterota bacterium]